MQANILAFARASLILEVLSDDESDEDPDESEDDELLTAFFTTTFETLAELISLEPLLEITARVLFLN